MTHLIHLIHGYTADEDFHSFEIQLTISIDQLKAIMGWTRDDECFLGYKLTEPQIAAIKAITHQSVPAELELYLSSEVD